MRQNEVSIVDIHSLALSEIGNEAAPLPRNFTSLVRDVAHRHVRDAVYSSRVFQTGPLRPVTSADEWVPRIRPWTCFVSNDDDTEIPTSTACQGQNGGISQPTRQAFSRRRSFPIVPTSRKTPIWSPNVQQTENSNYIPTRGASMRWAGNRRTGAAVYMITIPIEQYNNMQLKLSNTDRISQELVDALRLWKEEFQRLWEENIEYWL